MLPQLFAIFSVFTLALAAPSLIQKRDFHHGYIKFQPYDGSRAIYIGKAANEQYFHLSPNKPSIFVADGGRGARNVFVPGVNSEYGTFGIAVQPAGTYAANTSETLRLVASSELVSRSPRSVPHSGNIEGSPTTKVATTIWLLSSLWSHNLEATFQNLNEEELVMFGVADDKIHGFYGWDMNAIIDLVADFNAKTQQNVKLGMLQFESLGKVDKPPTPKIKQPTPTKQQTTSSPKTRGSEGGFDGIVV